MKDCDMLSRNIIKAEIRERNALNMRSVFLGLQFATYIGQKDDCVNEATQFLEDVQKMILGSISSGDKVNVGDLTTLAEKHPLPQTLRAYSDYIGKNVDANLSIFTIQTFLQKCHLFKEKEVCHCDIDVDLLTGWWYGLLGEMCCQDELFFTKEFVWWTTESVDLQFLLHYNIPRQLATSMVAEWNLSPKELLMWSYDFRDEERVDIFLSDERKRTDEESARDALHVLRQSGSVFFHPQLYSLSQHLIKAKLFEEWVRLFNNVDLPLLQASMLYNVKQAEDLLAIINVMKQNRPAKPLSAFSIVKEYMYNLFGKITGCLNSYFVEGTEDKLEKELLGLAKEASEEWNENYADYIRQALMALKSELSPQDIAGWAFGKRMLTPPRKTHETNGINQVTEVFKMQVLGLYQPDELPIEEGKLPYLTYVAKNCLCEGNNMDRRWSENLVMALINTVMKNKIQPVVQIDNESIEEFASAASAIDAFIDNDKYLIFEIFDREKVRYEGWNITKQEDKYDRCHGENYLLCWMLMVCDGGHFRDGNEQHHYWLMMMDKLFGQVRAADTYMKSEYMQTIILAGLIATQPYQQGLQLFLDKCCKYIVFIDDLIMVLANAGVLRYIKEHSERREALELEVYSIKKRIENEWPLIRLKLKMEGPSGKSRLTALDSVVNDFMN